MSETVEGVVMPDVTLSMANGKPLVCSVSDDAIIVTALVVVDLAGTGEGGISVVEHDNLVNALVYLAGEPDVISGNWSRVFIGNREELDRERAVAGTWLAEPEDDGSPCCIAFVTSKGQDHVPGCEQ